MKCPNCEIETGSKDKFCNNCGHILTGEEVSYLNEMRKTIKDQNAEKKFEDIESIDLHNPTEILKAQLKVMISIHRRLERLENKEKDGNNVRVRDFDMPFWSLVRFELKVLFVTLFFTTIFGCLGFTIFGSFLGTLIQSMMQFLQ